MKTRYIWSFMITLLVFSACEKIDIPKIDESGNYNLVYMSAAVAEQKKTIIFKDTTYTLIYGANYGGGEAYPQANIDVDFEVNPDMVNAYNELNRTDYKLLPKECFDLSALEARIEKNQLSTEPLLITVNPNKGMELFKTYILPISIKEVAGDAKVNPSLSTAYYLITASLNLADFEDFDRSKWVVAGLSSEETAGEPAANGGHAVHAIDDDLATFWHTRWSGGNAPAPHFLEIDMGENKTVHGISIAARGGNNRARPQEIKVEVRSDKDENWTLVGNFYPLDNGGIQRVFFSKPHDARFFKVTVVKNYGNYEFTHIANLNMF